MVLVHHNEIISASPRYILMGGVDYISDINI